MKESKFPKWHRELDQCKAFKTTFILDGNIYDLHSYYDESNNGRLKLLTLEQYLNEYLTANGYCYVIFYNHIDGFYNNFFPSTVEALLGKNKQKVDLNKDCESIRNMMSNKTKPTAVVLNLASRYIESPDNLNESERKFYSTLLLTSLRPQQARLDINSPLIYNLLFIIANKANDIPAWLYLDNPNVKLINISKPDKSVRIHYINAQIECFLNGVEFNEDDLKKYKEKFVDATKGFKNIELNELRILCRQEGISINNIDKAISFYKYGIKENPWNEINGEKLENAESFIRERVKGQDVAVSQTLDIIKRAASGLSGLQHSSGTKPKGILFFAGPTGTGKTELAKTLASLLFGDENTCIRFDMSEYQQSQSDQKLLGAPPGYVGYEAGGQLTNAVREKPFSILLFDEIEKAHPSILDKFLQILEDGRMTDGHGNTVYFSESIIIFTSNLGIYTKDEYGRRVASVDINVASYKELKDKILKGIKDYFLLDLGRPELLNRIGNNFIVFDYIREETAREIINSQIEKIIKNLKANKNISISLAKVAVEYLVSIAFGNLENGGRGIGNIIEKYFINPLARYIFDYKVKANSNLSILNIYADGEIIRLNCELFEKETCDA